MTDLQREALDYPEEHRDEAFWLLQAREKLTDTLIASPPLSVYRKRSNALMWGIGITIMGGNLMWILAAVNVLPQPSWVLSTGVICVGLLLLIGFFRVSDIYDRNRRYEKALGLIPGRLAELHDDPLAGGGSWYIAFLIEDPVMRRERKIGLVLTSLVLALGVGVVISALITSR